MKKCDHCAKEAIVTYDIPGTWQRSDVYVGGLCPDHDTDENRDAIVERWRKLT